MASVERYMIADVKTIGAGAPAAEVAELLAHENVRDVLVVDDEGRLVGVLDSPPAAGGLAGEAAAPAPPAVAADADARATLERMRRDDLRRLAVVDESGRPVGILARAPLERRLQHDERRGRA